MVSFETQKYLILIRSNLAIFFFNYHTFDVNHFYIMLKLKFLYEYI